MYLSMIFIEKSKISEVIFVFDEQFIWGDLWLVTHSK